MPDRRVAAALAVLGALAATACQPDQQQAVTVTRAGMPMAPASEPPALVPAVPDPVDPGDDDGEQLALATRLPPDIGASPAKLRGLESGLIRAGFGPPTFRRRDKTAEVWQYYGQGCILDLFLYQEDGKQRVAHYHLRSRDAGGAVDGGCYAGLVRAR